MWMNYMRKQDDGTYFGWFCNGFSHALPAADHTMVIQIYVYGWERFCRVRVMCDHWWLGYLWWDWLLEGHICGKSYTYAHEHYVFGVRKVEVIDKSCFIQENNIQLVFVKSLDDYTFALGIVDDIFRELMRNTLLYVGCDLHLYVWFGALDTDFEVRID